MKKFFTLIAFTCALIPNIQGMQTVTTMARTGLSVLCSTAEGLTTLLPIAGILFDPNDLRAEKLKDTLSDAPEPIIHFITQLAAERKIDNVKVCLNGNCHDYCTEDNGRIIYIPALYAQELESLLNKNKLGADDTKKLNEHCASIHHELTHIAMRSQKNVAMYQPIIGIVGGVAISTALTLAIKKYLPVIDNNLALYNAFKIIRGICTFYIGFEIARMNIYKKYDELQADDGIPNQKELLEAAAQKYETRHAELVGCVNHVKNKYPWMRILFEPMNPEATLSRSEFIAMKLIPTCCFEYPLLTELIIHTREEHPSDLRRANRFKNRITQLENVTVNK